MTWGYLTCRFKTPYLEVFRPEAYFFSFGSKDDRHEGSSVESALKDSCYWSTNAKDQCLYGQVAVKGLFCMQETL